MWLSNRKRKQMKKNKEWGLRGIENAMRHEIGCDDHGKTKLRATWGKLSTCGAKRKLIFQFTAAFFVDVNPIYGTTCRYAKPRSITQKSLWNFRKLSAKSESSSCCNKSSQIFSSESFASASDFSKCQLYFSSSMPRKMFSL